MVDFTNEQTEATRKQELDYERSQRYRFQEQCFLNYWKTHIFQKLNNYPGGRRTRILKHGGTQPFSDNPRTSPLQSVYTYQHLNILDSKYPSKLISVFNQKKGAEHFFNLDSSILSQLKPIVEIYKIYPAQTYEANSGTTTTKLYQIPMPLGENITKDKEAMPSRGKLSSIEEIFYDHKVLGNAMLTGLNFKFAGQNIALLNTIEDVSFTISFSSFNMFTHLFKTKIPDGKDANNQTILKDFTWSYQDLISYSTRYLPTQASATEEIDAIQKDLACYENPDTFISKSKSVQLEDNLNPDYWEIQMAVRYDPDDINWELVEKAAVNSGGRLQLNSGQKRALKNFLRTSAIIMRLQFVAHTVRYSSNSSGADPELVIDFEYKAFIENSLNSPELDILKLPGSNARAVQTWENNLARARRLLYVVTRERKTVSDIFGSSGEAQTELQQQYSTLRGTLETAYNKDDLPESSDGGNLLQWLIFSTVKVNGRSPAGQFGIIPTDRHIQIAEGPEPVNRRGRPVPRRAEQRSVREGLTFNPDKPAEALGSTENARKIFEELVNKLAAYIKLLRTTYAKERYGSFFKALYAQERVYAVKLATEKLAEHTGFTAEGEAEEVGDKQTTAATMANRRQTMDQILPGPVSIIRSNIVWDDNTDAAQSGQTPLNQNLEQLNTEFQKINVKRIENSVSSTANTLGQEIQESLGSTSMAKPSVIGSNSYIYFTNLGDIIDTAIAIASYPNYGLYRKRMGILMGPMIEDDHSAQFDGVNLKFILNLAHVPVSLKTVMGFFATKVIAPGRERYLLNDFIKDLVEDLILPALGSRCVEGAPGGNQQLGTVTFATKMKEIQDFAGGTGFDKMPPFYPENPAGRADYPKGGSSAYLINISPGTATAKGQFNGPSWEPIRWSRGGKLKDLTSVSPNTPIEEQFNYMLVYVNNISPTRLDPKNETENIGNGIYYLHLGQIPSIIKQATFRKENIPYVREARAMGHLTRTGGIALRDVYHINCTMYGNNIFKPGQLVFVDPTRDGSTDYGAWQSLGLVGFYRIIEVDHEVYAGMNPIHETSVSAKWETFGSCIEADNGLISTEYMSQGKTIGVVSAGMISATTGAPLEPGGG